MGHGRRAVLRGLGVAGVGVISGCLGTGDDSGDGRIRIGLSNEPTDGDWEQFGGVTPYYTPFHETLTAAARDLDTVEPRLAHDWGTVDRSTWHFSLREDVRFHDGTELTASVTADALAALIEARPLGFTRFTPESFTAVDDYELEIETTEPEPATPGNLAHPLLGLQHPDSDDPTGTGPYVADSVEYDGRVTASVFEDSWREPGKAPLVFEGVTDPKTRTLKLEAGELDVAMDLPRVSYAELEANADVRVRSKIEPRTGMVMVNRYRDPTADRDLRRALLYATDQSEIVAELLEGIGEPARSPFSPVIPWSAHDDLPEYDDMDRARELVESSSYGGEPLRFIVESDAREQHLIAQRLQQRFDEIGVSVDIVQIESAAFYSEYTSGQADLAFVEFGSINGVADYLVYVMYHSEGGDNRQLFESDGTGIVNLGGAVDELIEQGDSSFDKSEKHGAYREVQRRVMKDAATIPIYYKEYVVGTRQSIDGPTLHSIPHMTDWTTVSR